MMTALLTREEFLRKMAIEASRLERLARQIREGKWETFNIEESINHTGRGSGTNRPTQEKVTIVIRASRLQAYGTGLDISLDEEPARPHQFDGSWQPHPEKRGDEHERYEVTCSMCGLTIVDPTDIYPVDHCPATEALTPEWLALIGLPERV